MNNLTSSTKNELIWEIGIAGESIEFDSNDNWLGNSRKSTDSTKKMLDDRHFVDLLFQV